MRWLLEILTFAREQMYGRSPHVNRMHTTVLENDEDAFDGKARRFQVKLLLQGTANGPSAMLLLYLPRDTLRPPVILSLNYYGNHTVCDDPDILISKGYFSTLNPRSSDAHRRPIAQMIDKGYAFATIGRQDIDPDESSNGHSECLAGIRLAFPEL